MSTIVRAVRRTARAIDVEGAFIIGGLAGLTFVAWTLAPVLGVAVASVVLVGLGILFADR